MSKLSKKIGSILCIAVLALSSTTFISAAGNITDEQFHFDFTGVGNSHNYTKAREKRDATAMYMNVVSKSINKFSVKPFAYAGGKRIYHKGLPEKLIQSEGVYYITNFVWEDGYRYGGIDAYRDMFNGGSAYGLWSPDSIR